MTTDKESISRLVQICRLKNIKHIVFSPGSRNAPLVIAFNAVSTFNIYTIHDERVAAFFAMGIAQKTKETVAICCTSGTAALNYAPAIAEAYYQGIPLLILTADRPIEWIDQGIGQSMRQRDVYSNYIKKSYQLFQTTDNDNEVRYNDRQILEAINLSQRGKKGPVHINIPLEEPLYNKTALVDHDIRLISEVSLDRGSKVNLSAELINLLNTTKKKVILAGSSLKDHKLEQILNELSLSGKFIILTETTSNLFIENGIQCIDRTIDSIVDIADYAPDLLITFGGPVISKKIKTYFQKNKPKYHWDIRYHFAQDTFGALTHHINLDTDNVAQFIEEITQENSSDFNNLWYTLNEQKKLKHQAFCKDLPDSDFSLFHTILNNIPDDTILHLSNSSVVRYVQLFNQNPTLEYYANRGVSGIDGSTSTAIGFSNVSEKQNIFITGDVAFFYDSNAFWLKYIPDNLKIILINNGGGSIFRIIPGPSDSEHLETHFEAHHKTKADSIAITFGINYLSLDYTENNKAQIIHFLTSETPCTILEILTPRETNATVLRDYFSFLK